MAVRQPRHSKEEFAQRGDALYESEVRAQVEEGNHGKIVAIDIETGAFEVDKSEIAACDRLEASHPDAQVWMVRIGSRHVRRFGGRMKRAVWSPELSTQILSRLFHFQFADQMAKFTRKMRSSILALMAGFHCLPIWSLNWIWNGRGEAEAILGDGSECVFNVYEAVLVWDRNFLTIPIDGADSEPLVGMSLMEGYQLMVHVFEGGRVELSKVATV